MNGSFIGKNEIDDFLENLSKKDNSIFAYGEDRKSGAHKSNKDLTTDSESEVTFEETNYRFYILIFFCLLSFSNGMQWVTFSPIAKSFKKNFDLNTFQTDLFSLIYMIVYPFVTPVSSYIIDNKSMRLGIFISGFLTCLGAGIKCLLDSGIFFLYLGQFFAAVGQPFFLNSPAKIASTWFREDKNHYNSPPFFECLKIMFRNKNFILLLISFTCILGYFNLYGTILNELFTKYSLSELEMSMIGGFANILALVAVLTISVLIDKYKKYRTSFIILNTIGIISHIGMTLALEYITNNLVIYVAILWSICSVAILPIYTCSMDFVCELTYPVGESISGGFIMTCTQISGIISILICDHFIENVPDKRYLSNIVGLVFIVVSLFITFFIEEKLKRHEKDSEVIYHSDKEYQEYDFKKKKVTSSEIFLK